MKSKRRLFFTLFVLIGSLVALTRLSNDGNALVYANGTTQEKILVSVSNSTWTDDVLYTLNPDGSGQASLFDFHSHPKHTAGRILQPCVAADGGAIYFSSDNAYAYTPASRNLFRIASDGSWWDQITPGPNSGSWNQPYLCRRPGADDAFQDQGERRWQPGPKLDR